MTSTGVIGSGAWGTTLALLLASKGTETTMWEHRPERAVEMQQRRENTMFLPGFRFPDNLCVTSDVKEAVAGKDMLLLVTPSQRMRENVRVLAPYVNKETILVSASKGIDFLLPPNTVSTRQMMSWVLNSAGHSRISLQLARVLMMA